MIQRKVDVTDMGFIEFGAYNVTLGSNVTEVMTVTANEVIFNKPIVFEGATADAFETTLTVVDPTADRTITLPNATTTLVGTDTTDTLTNKTLTSPTFTGTPLSTTAAVDTNTTQIATTAYVVGQGYAKLASPTFTGTPTLPTGTIATTQTALDSTTKVATTAFVTTADNLKERNSQIRFYMEVT